MDYFLLFVGCGLLSGVTTALFGFGGGFIVVPLLFQTTSHMQGLGARAPELAMQVAVATSTCVMIFGSLMATWRHQKADNLEWPVIRPLLGPIAVGAAFGAWSAVAMSGTWLRGAFILYLALTLLDSGFRPGFLHQPAQTTRQLSTPSAALYGVIVGWIAALLGVGGSVMTVPLLRRRGVSMAKATAMANPLTMPVALVATAVHAALSWREMAALDTWHLGYIDLRSALALMVGTLFGIRVAAPLTGRISDRLHARVYLGMLATVLLSMVFR